MQAAATDESRNVICAVYVALAVTAWRMVAVVVVSVSVVVADVEEDGGGCCRTFAVCGAIRHTLTLKSSQ